MSEAIELRDGIEASLKSLRKCDTQATAVQWMSNAYKLMEACLPYLEPPRDATGSAIFTFKRPEIVVTSEMPTKDYIVRKPREVWYTGQTVVYPEVPLPPARPKPWTREDTLRLERASKFGKHHIQRLGQ